MVKALSLVNSSDELEERFRESERKEVRPGVFWRDVEFHGCVLRFSEVVCQDCGDTNPMRDVLMLKDELWYQLYPDDGVACTPCIEKRLGRKIQPEDQHPTKKVKPSRT
jgi:hypothetical protein